MKKYGFLLYSITNKLEYVYSYTLNRMQAHWYHKVQWYKILEMILKIFSTYLYVYLCLVVQWLWLDIKLKFIHLYISKSQLWQYFFLIHRRILHPFWGPINRLGVVVWTNFYQYSNIWILNMIRYANTV